MAKADKYGEFDEMRGKLGKKIISKNRYGTIIYEQPEYIDKKTPGQIRTRVLHNEVMKLWRTLSPKDINYISMKASDTDIRRICKPANVSTAYLLFFYLKRNLQEIGESIDTKITGVERGVQYINEFRVELNRYRGKPGLKLFFKPDIDKETKLIVYGTPCLPGGRSKPKTSDYRKITVLDNNFKSGTYITKAYLNIFKEIDEEMMSIHFKFKTVNKISGVASNPETTVFTLIIKQNT